MKFNRLCQVALSLTLVAGFGTHAVANTYTVYKSTGADGVVKYSQSAPKDSRNVEVLQLRSDGRQNTPGDFAPPPVNSNETTQSNQAAELERRLKEMDERENAQRCRNLRNNLAHFNVGGKIYEMDDKGNRIYLNSQEINVRRETTQRMIEQYCQ